MFVTPYNFCDAEKEIGIAGIMGGENSMITDDVKNDFA